MLGEVCLQAGTDWRWRMGLVCNAGGSSLSALDAWAFALY